MHIAYLVITILVALANSYAASLNFAGAESVKVVANHVEVSQKWMIPFGILLASGAAGCWRDSPCPRSAQPPRSVWSFTSSARWVRTSEYTTHRSPGAVSFLVLAVAALIADLAYHNHW